MEFKRDAYNSGISLSLREKETQRGKFGQWTSSKLVLSRPEVVTKMGCHTTHVQNLLKFQR